MTLNDDSPIEPDCFPLTTRDGLELFGRRWKAGESERGIVVLVHGLGEHSGRYGFFASQLALAGYEVLSYDQRGYGRSPRGRWPNYNELLDDLESALGHLDEQDGRSRFLLGQSFGGNLILNLALRRSPRVSGLIAASPMLRLAQPPPLWKQLALRSLAKVWPSFSIRTGIRSEQLTTNQQLQQKYQSDTLIRRRVALQLARSMIDSGEWAAKRGAELELPALLLHGAVDEVTCFEASRGFAESGRMTEFYAIETGRHELLHSGNDTGVVDCILDWLAEAART